MISVAILTKNAEKTLGKTLSSLKAFPEVLVYDTGSSDKTLEIAKQFSNVTVKQGIFQGFGPTHNTASLLGSYDWILSIDSDEVLTEELVQEILHLNLDPESVYEIRRHNFFNGKRIRGCSGWDPDYVTRLYNRKKTAFDEAHVHEKVQVKNLKKQRLEGALIHTPYLKIEDFLSKMQNYSTLFANQKKTAQSQSVGGALAHGWWAFLKSYFLKRGFLAGKEGLIISLYNGHATFYKYLKLAETQESQKSEIRMQK